MSANGFNCELTAACRAAAKKVRASFIYLKSKLKKAATKLWNFLSRWEGTS